MDVIASFPTVRIDGPEVGGEDSASCAPVQQAPEVSRRRAPRPARGIPPWSITILSIAAVVVWAAVWWTERGTAGTRQPTHVAEAGEQVTR
ncbi:MAG: hypothetical protein EBZ74_07225 [Planctomycetia bacterium]|nr:hypothetical protein [Planctomycetia bacterium]